MIFTDDQHKFTWIKENLYVAVICDVLDSLGFRQQSMHQRLRPLDGENCTMVGRARTLRWMEIDHNEADPYGPLLAFMDSLQAGDVVVNSTDRLGNNAPWGELMTTVAMLRGSSGCICDSQIRDCLRIKDLKYPIFMAGIRALDSAGRARVMACDVPVQCGDVVVQPKDIVFSDFDGVVVIPCQVEDEAIKLAYEKVQMENKTRDALLQGRTLTEVYEEFGIL